MARQPMLPGFNFGNTKRKDFHLNQHFKHVNGYSIPKLNLNELTDTKLEPFFNIKHRFQAYDIENGLIKLDPLEKYNYRKTALKAFTPRYVINSGKCLSFQGYFKQQEGPTYIPGNFSCRKINLIYYLEDDTMTIVEPPVAVRNKEWCGCIENSGYLQGRLVRRGRIAKPNSSLFWHWKDLNTGIHIDVYGIVYHLSSCDPFTREYLRSQGIEVNENKEIPYNFYEDDITSKNVPSYHGNEELIPWRDKLYKFLQYDRKVLRFYIACYENEEECDETEHYKMYYYLIDDTVEIREIVSGAEQNAPFKRLLSRTKLPKNTTCFRKSGTSVICSKLSEQYYELKDFLVGNHIYIFRKKFLVYDCDEFTRRYYKEYLKLEHPIAMVIPKKQTTPPVRKIPPHFGVGQPEDTLRSCLSIVPKPPRKNVIHYVENTNKFLRYLAKLDSTGDSDRDRDFIIQYSLADGKISIYEIGKPNSGFTSGYFLKSTLIPKISSGLEPIDNGPIYYSAHDLIIGANIHVFGRKFTITGADLAVYRHIQNEPLKFGEEIRSNIGNYLKSRGILCEDVENGEKDIKKVKGRVTI